MTKIMFFFVLLEAGHYSHPASVVLATFMLSPSQTHQPWRSAQKVNETTPALAPRFLNWFHTHLCTFFNYTQTLSHTHKALWRINTCFKRLLLVLIYKTYKIKMKMNENEPNLNLFNVSPTVNEWTSSSNLTLPWQQQIHTLQTASYRVQEITKDRGMYLKI